MRTSGLTPRERAEIAEMLDLDLNDVLKPLDPQWQAAVATSEKPYKEEDHNKAKGRSYEPKRRGSKLEVTSSRKGGAYETSEPGEGNDKDNSSLDFHPLLFQTIDDEVLMNMGSNHSSSFEEVVIDISSDSSCSSFDDVVMEEKESSDPEDEKKEESVEFECEEMSDSAEEEGYRSVSDGVENLVTEKV